MASRAETICEERDRIRQILESPEGLLRPKTAVQFALYTDMNVALATTTLANMPKEQTAFSEAMDTTGTVGIRPSGASPGGFIAGGDQKAARLAEIKSGTRAYNISRGFRPKDAN